MLNKTAITPSIMIVVVSIIISSSSSILPRGVNVAGRRR